MTTTITEAKRFTTLAARAALAGQCLDTVEHLLSHIDGFKPKEVAA